MPADKVTRAEEPSRHGNVYDATMQAMHAGSTDARLDALGAKIDDLSRSIDRRFEQVDRRFESLEDRFTRMQHVLMAGFLAIIAALLAAHL